MLGLADGQEATLPASPAVEGAIKNGKLIEIPEPDLSPGQLDFDQADDQADDQGGAEGGADGTAGGAGSGEGGPGESGQGTSAADAEKAAPGGRKKPAAATASRRRASKAAAASAQEPGGSSGAGDGPGS